MTFRPLPTDDELKARVRDAIADADSTGNPEPIRATRDLLAALRLFPPVNDDILPHRSVGHRKKGRK